MRKLTFYAVLVALAVPLVPVHAATIDDGFFAASWVRYYQALTRGVELDVEREFGVTEVQIDAYYEELYRDRLRALKVISMIAHEDKEAAEAFAQGMGMKIGDYPMSDENLAESWVVYYLAAIDEHPNDVFWVFGWNEDEFWGYIGEVVSDDGRLSRLLDTIAAMNPDSAVRFADGMGISYTPR